VHTKVIWEEEEGGGGGEDFMRVFLKHAHNIPSWKKTFVSGLASM